MTIYRYRATDAAGKIARGETDAINEYDLDAQLRKAGLDLIRARPAKKVENSLCKLSRRELINFLFQLEMLLRAGVPIQSILADLRDTAEVPPLRNLCANLYEKIDSGSTLSEAFAANPAIFPELVINLVRAGEGTGQLPYVLQETIASLKWQDELTSKIRQLLTYPAFATLVITAVVIFLMSYLIPQLVGFISNMGGDLPFQTRLLIRVSDIFVRYGWYFRSIRLGACPSPIHAAIADLPAGKNLSPLPAHAACRAVTHSVYRAYPEENHPVTYQRHIGSDLSHRHSGAGRSDLLPQYHQQPHRKGIHRPGA